ncbi:MAG: NFACT RNA binding domain-containing protein [Lachnospiraceae bacterium]|nr:NFACT RNA binding domain-containing protein [Lachnospiraceae bacterium]
MAFDGITISNIVTEFNQTLLGGRLYKIAQPEPDELLLTIKNNLADETHPLYASNSQYRLLLSADASLPLAYLTGSNKTSPMTAPNFCMLLRKHIQNGRIIAISQPGLERCIQFDIEHLDEMGDLCQKSLIIELMGKHSNIIFCDDKRMIIDSIKHISGMVSSVREVLPGRPYFIPETQNKVNPLDTDPDSFQATLSAKAIPVYKAIYSTYTGLSPVIANELCAECALDADRPATTLDSREWASLYQTFSNCMTRVKEKQFAPRIVYECGKPVEYAALPLTMYAADESVEYSSISRLLEQYYAERNAYTRIRQKSVDLRKIVQTALERNVKKYDLQCQQMKDTEKRDKFKVYGELLHTYGYTAALGDKSLTALNYYTNENLTIPLDPTLTATENAKKYFDKYNKLKRTFEALSELTKEVKSEIDHLESISNALDIAAGEEDLVQIKEEMIEAGYIRRKGGGKKAKITSKPFHYVSSDGFDIYVGKNNYQNDELTFKFATGNDWWFHSKKFPGSHVIVKTNGEELPDRTFEEAGRLAAHYSKGREQEKVEIDYTQKKNVKKPGGANPGFVVYYTNYSMMIDSDITGIAPADNSKN